MNILNFWTDLQCLCNGNLFENVFFMHAAILSLSQCIKPDSKRCRCAIGWTTQCCHKIMHVRLSFTIPAQMNLNPVFHTQRLLVHMWTSIQISQYGLIILNPALWIKHRARTSRTNIPYQTAADRVGCHVWCAGSPPDGAQWSHDHDVVHLQANTLRVNLI